MNTKRQTVWLVSMLSIMVVLSAYYLFTSDVDDLDLVSNDLNTNEIVLEHSESGIVESEGNEDVMFMDDLLDGKTEDEILQEVQTQQQSGYGYFTTLHLDREEGFKEEIDRLYSVAAVGSTEAQTDAHDQIARMEDKWTKLSHIEELIMRDFANAFITEVNNKWKIEVQTDQLEKSQAVTMINMVMNEMNASPDQVFVEIKQP